MFCSKCGSKIDDNAKFCTYCGARTKVPMAVPADEFKEPAAPAAEEVKAEAPVFDTVPIIEVPEESAPVSGGIYEEIVPEAEKAEAVSEPVVEELPEAEPVVEELPAAEPVVEEIAEPVIEEIPAVEPVIEEAPAPEEPAPEPEAVAEEAPAEAEPAIDEAPAEEEPAAEEAPAEEEPAAEEIPAEEVPAEEEPEAEEEAPECCASEDLPFKVCIMPVDDNAAEIEGCLNAMIEKGYELFDMNIVNGSKVMMVFEKFN